MIKRTLILLVIGVFFICSLTACGETTSNEPDKTATELSNFKTIDGKDYLVYNLDTRVVYYMFSTRESAGYSGYGYSYFAPYISKNGNFCKYDDGQIIEITSQNSND